MNAVGIDVSKGKNMITVMRLFVEVVTSPYEVSHTAGKLEKLADFLKSLDGETLLSWSTQATTICQPPIISIRWGFLLA